MMSSASAYLPMRATGPCSAAGLRVRSDLALERRPPGQDLAPGPDGLVRLLPTDRHLGVGRVRDTQECVLDRPFDLSQLGIQGRDPLARRERRRLQVGHLGTVRLPRRP